MYVDKALLSGLRSAPKILTAVADALELIAKRWGPRPTVPVIRQPCHSRPSGTDECQKNLDILLSVCALLGVPQPAWRLTILKVTNY